MSLIQKPSNIWRYQEKSHQPYWIVQKAFWFTIFLWNLWFTNLIASCRGKRTFRWKSHSWARTQRTGPGRPPPASSSWSTPAGPWPPSSGTPASQPQPPASAALPPGLWPQLASAQETVVSAATTWVGQRASRASEAATGWEEWTEPASWVASVAVATAEAPQVSGWGPPPWSSWSPRRTGMRGAGARPRRPPPSPWSKGCTGPETLLRRLSFAASVFLERVWTEQGGNEGRNAWRGFGHTPKALAADKSVWCQVSVREPGGPRNSTSCVLSPNRKFVRFAGTQHGRSGFRHSGADLLRLSLSVTWAACSSAFVLQLLFTKAEIAWHLKLPNFENSDF